MNFKINSRPLFTIIFKLKNVNFKTRDFSPLIERVLAGVYGDASYIWKNPFVFSKEGRKLVKINKTCEIITNLHVLDIKMDQMESN